MSGRNLPLIGIPSCLRTINERAFHTVNERYPNAVIDAVGGLPLLIPAIGPKTDYSALLDRLDGRAGRARCTIPTATRRRCP